MRIDVKHSLGDIAEQLKKLHEQVADRVMARTLNKVIDGARGRMATEIAGEFMITKREANERLVIRRATAKGGRFYLSAALVSPSNGKRGLNLIRFVRGRRVKGGKGRPQLTFKIKRAGGTVKITGAFIGNQGRTVFERVGKGRQPIRSVSTIDVPQMFNARRVNQRVLAYIEQRLPVVFAQEVRFATR